MMQRNEHDPWLEDVRLFDVRHPGAAPHPEQVLGFALGTRAAQHHEILRYLQALAAAVPERVCLTEYGRSWEDRPLVYLTVSSEGNLRRRDAIEARLRRPDDSLGDPLHDPLCDPREDERASEMHVPVVCWLGHGMHGDELSGCDAALLLAYRLAAAEDSTTRALREQLLIHIDPVANPDGRERYLATVRAQAGSVPRLDPQDIAHTGCWPWGRANHYLFDLNRDGVALTQPESRARAAALRRTSPQLVIEVHEMASDDTFLFAAPAEPINSHVPEHVRNWWRRFAADVGQAFQLRHASFYTRGWNEVFYPGYADIWPAYHGAVPLLLEQSTTSGIAVEQPSGRVVRYADCIAAHLTAELSNLGTAARGRERLLTDWFEYRRRITREPGAIRGYLIDARSAPERVAELLGILFAHGIEVWRAVQHGDAYLVRLDQPLAALVRNLLDTSTPLPADFEESEGRRMREGGVSQLYDVTAWALPLAFDVEVSVVAELPAGDWVRLDGVPTSTAATVAGIGIGTSTGTGTEAAGDFICRDPFGALAASLLTAGVRPRLATESFTYNDQEYAAGTLIVRAQDNRTGLSARVLTESGASVTHAGTGSLSQSGPDLGCRSFHLLHAPRIAVLTGPGTDPGSYGAIWYLFDRTLRHPITAIELARLGSVPLRRYDVLIVPELAEDVAIPPAHADRLRAWVASGGTLIGSGSGALALASQSCGLTRTRPSRASEANTSRAPRREWMPRGVYLHTRMSPGHWLAYGSNAEMPALFRANDCLCPGDDVEVPARFASADTLLRSGRLWPEQAAYIAATAYVVRERQGAGQVVLFASDPLFRGHAFATQRLFVNAALFGASFIGRRA